MDIELCIRTNEFAIIKFAMTDFAIFSDDMR
jgi:hypothetical protein